MNAEYQSRRAQAGELSVHAQTVLDSNVDPSGSLALILAREAMLATLQTDRFVTVNADAALREAVDTAPPYRMRLPRYRHAANVLSASYSPDGTQIVTSGADGLALIWDAASGRGISRN